MNSERWRRVESLFHHAVELNDADRAAYLEASNDDSELLREVRDLLSSYETPDSFIEKPVFKYTSS